MISRNVLFDVEERIIQKFRRLRVIKYVLKFYFIINEFILFGMFFMVILKYKYWLNFVFYFFYYIEKYNFIFGGLYIKVFILVIVQ